MHVLLDTPRPVKVWATDLEEEAETQVRNLSTLPFIHSHVSVMPDAHAGKGSTIGTVIATRGAIIPATLGVDLGCGIKAVLTPFTASQLNNLDKLRHQIERSVPTGRYGNKIITDNATWCFSMCGELSETTRPYDLTRAREQMGSLGGGNHFIEVCLDKQDRVWVILHSGSRNIGKMLAEVHIHKAKDIMKRYFINLPDPDLAYLAQGTQEFRDYLIDVTWAQKYAAANRSEMMRRVLCDLSRHILGNADTEPVLLEQVDCHHNYTQLEHHYGKNVYVTRKGAVSARAGEMGIIPGSMGTKSFIVRGKGSAESFNSCSHGAGRKMSRTKARATFTLEDFQAQTKGVECRKDTSVIDEIPGAYKDVDEVMRNQADLCEIVHELRQVVCVKGD